MISLVLRPLGVGTKSPEVIQSSGLATTETFKTSRHQVGSPKCQSPSLTAALPLLERPLKAGTGDIKSHCHLMNSRLLRWHALKYLFGPRYKSMLDVAFLKAFSCFNSVSHVKNRDRRAPVSASFCILHCSVLRKGDGGL